VPLELVETFEDLPPRLLDYLLGYYPFYDIDQG
jgi:hypothetical protein